MATRPDQFPAIAARQAKSPEVARLFEQLAGRAETFARMQDEFLESILRNRQARTGKPFRNTKRQQKFLDESDKDAERAVREMERVASTMDERSLLISALSSHHQQLRLDEGMASSYRPEDKEMAERLIEFRRETIRLIEQFVETSPFRGQVASVWQAKKKNDAV